MCELLCLSECLWFPMYAPMTLVYVPVETLGNKILHDVKLLASIQRRSSCSTHTSAPLSISRRKIQSKLDMASFLMVSIHVANEFGLI